ncbi:MAG: VWA domain-containing protein [Alphaproteobacteria bacterium]|nr:VWA domain-containing protein [Alphaproteobacteria bacterium]
MYRYLVAITAFLILAPQTMAAPKQETMVLAPDTGLIRKVVAGSNKIKAFQKPDSSSSEAYTLELLQPYYVMAEEGEYLKITNVAALTQDEAEKGKVGYVLAEQIHDWPTREALHFLPFTLSDDRNPIDAWDDEGEIRKFFETGDKISHPPTFREDIKSTLAREGDLRPYPVLDSFETDFMGRTKKTVHKVLLPAAIAPSTGVVMEEDEKQKLEKVLSSVTFNIVFDATGSMGPIASDVADQLLGAIESMGEKAVEQVKVGYVFYRDEGDEEPSLITPATSVGEAANFLREYAGRMTGGGDTAEPVLDAVYMSAELFDWTAGDAQNGSRRVAVIVLNGDAKPRTTGAIDSRVPANQTPAEIGKVLVENRILAITVQAGESAGENLLAVLQRVAELTNGEFVKYGPDMRGRVGTAIRKSFADKISTAATEAREVAGKAIIKDGKAVVPLAVLDAEKLARLREAGVKFNIDDRKGGILVHPGYMPENKDLLDPQVRIEKDTLQRLLNLFSVLSATGIDATDLRASVEESIAAMAGERPNPGDDIASIVRKKLGLKFRTELLSFNIEYLEGLTPKERLSLQKRIKEAADRLGDFLDARVEEFDISGSVWMPVGFLP